MRYFLVALLSSTMLLLGGRSSGSKTSQGNGKDASAVAGDVVPQGGSSLGGNSHTGGVVTSSGGSGGGGTVSSSRDASSSSGGASGVDSGKDVGGPSSGGTSGVDGRGSTGGITGSGSSSVAWDAGSVDASTPFPEAGPSDGKDASIGATEVGGPDAQALLDAPPSLSGSAVFVDGKAVGAISGFGWVTPGKHDTLTSPTCDNSAMDGGAVEPITATRTCAEPASHIVWPTSDGLCVSGNIAQVLYWDDSTNPGIVLAANVSAPPGGTLDGRYRYVVFDYVGNVTPSDWTARAEVHRRGDDASRTYCARALPGAPVKLLAFNTKCWDDSGDILWEDDIGKIDWIGLHILMTDRYAYAVTSFCWTGLRLYQRP